MTNKVLGGSLLIAGSAIGAGVLAVPVLTAHGGFFPATFLYIVLWLFSMATGLCFLEVMTWMKESKNQVNMLSMAESILGHVGKISICLVYLFLFYSLLIAYFCEGGNILCRIFNCQNLGIPWIRHLGPLGFALLMGPIIMGGTKVVDYCNRFFVFGLALAFGIFCVLGLLKIQPSFLLRSSWLVTMNAFPVFFLAFGFQSIIPTLYYYMDKKVKDVKKAIIIGTLIPLLLYVLWEAVVLGAVSLPILAQAKIGGYTAVEALKQAHHSFGFYVAGELFGFFALVSSFVGVALGVMDFLADGLRWNKKSHPFSIFFLTFIIPLAWAICYPEIVLTCLKYAGGFGAAIIIGLFPTVIVWKGRYGKQKHKEKQLVPGGRFTLFLMFLMIVINVVSLYYGF
ncbi:Tyrosine permease,tyrosine transporter TyrP,aromatic amino acid transport protein,Tryptophan/tyrosine permease family [Chlamydia serpentis]|uniref:Tyrosine permease,tyrosine transporter TyrP,aromatic amino acid transport protein,Tryptophan/tyrosine permease family n=1 Tax=Chlamydia serpentis TaxID=1967782 RepID=A0A2R8FCN2_9CHLA|nr:aromatic amino acid transport family protein [Chlamydia serpentis]SPN74076.1 Tyrosine permease,tyrosine transporter TyrP,aromatic amino acid transport protein,Tryptophan/tyrosine permease family [Chlamydia serpentis]